MQVDQEAEGKRQEAAELAEQHRVRLQEVDKEIALKKAEAQKEIDSMREEQLAEAQKQAEAILGQAKAAAEQERQEIMDKMSDQLKDLVLNAAEKVMLKDRKGPLPAVPGSGGKGGFQWQGTIKTGLCCGAAYPPIRQQRKGCSMCWKKSTVSLYR